jgi:hypothetical protein
MIEAANLTPDKLRAMQLATLKAVASYLRASLDGAMAELGERERVAQRQGGSIMRPNSVAVRHKSAFEK